MKTSKIRALLQKISWEEVLFSLLTVLFSLGGMLFFLTGTVRGNPFYQQLGILCFAGYFCTAGIYGRLRKKKAAVFLFLPAILLLLLLKAF